MGATALLHDVEAETLQITRFRKVGGRKSHAFAGLRTAPATHRARNTANTFHAECCKTQVLGPYHGGGGGGVVANREPGSYTYIHIYILHYMLCQSYKKAATDVTIVILPLKKINHG